MNETTREGDSRPQSGEHDAQVEAPADPIAAPRPSIADGLERRLDPRYVDLNQVIGAIMTAVLSVALVTASLIVWASADLPWWSLGALLLLSAMLTLGAWRFLSYWPVLEHRHHSYRVDALGIEIRIGVWWRKVISVPRSRIQHTDVSQGPLQRGYGLATLHIHTAGTEQALVELPGLDLATAMTIRDHLVTGGADDAL